MEYTDIIHNLLAEPEHIKQCLDTISKLESTISSQVELLHLTRHITLEKIDFDTKSNSSDTLKEILKELECPTNKTSDTDDSILSLKISSILDSFIQNLSANDRNIYIFRYFFGYSIDNISSLCNCSTNNISKVLSATNSMVITELKNAGIQYTTKTLLNSFGDIDDKHLISTVNNESNSKNSDSKANTLGNKTKKILPSWKILLNVIFSISIIVLVAVIIVLSSNTSDSEKVSATGTENKYDYARIFKYATHGDTTSKDDMVVDIDGLLYYCIDADFYSPSINYSTDNFTATYDPIPLDNDLPLEDCIGDEIIELQSEYAHCYRLKGYNSSEYIIREFNDTLTLYHLSFISSHIDTTADVRYSEILSNYYGLINDSQICEITATPSPISDIYGVYYTKKLFDNPWHITDIFQAIKNSTYTTTNLQVLIGKGELSYEYLMNSSVQLSIKKYDGTVIDTLYYRPEYHYFFDTHTFYTITPLSDDYNEHLDNMLAFTNHNAEPVNPDLWELAFMVSGENGTSIPVSITQNGDEPIEGLYLGSNFTLEKLENNKWSEPPICEDYIFSGTYPFETIIPVDGSSTTNYFFLESKYAPLTPGEYRITVTVYDSNSKDITNPASRNYTIKFDLNEYELSLE